MAADLSEFDIIDRFFNRPVHNPSRFPLGIGDDAALIAVPAGYELATSIDTLTAGTHFPLDSQAGDIGHKSLAVSLSDLAAMGAEPAAVLLALTLPQADVDWLAAFTAGFFALAKPHQVELIGGNLTRGPLSISTVTYGWAPAGQALRRSGAQPGDDIYVTGDLGGAGLALQCLQEHQPLTAALHQRFFRPEPRVQAGLALRGLATAAIDISDGLAADLGKLLTASGAGGEVDIEELPLAPDLRRLVTGKPAIMLALTAGEDYELCFTAPVSARSDLLRRFSALDCALHRIGVVTASPGLKFVAADGKLVEILKPGYQHF
jgi:thiamine-monophosphate kinase